MARRKDIPQVAADAYGLDPEDVAAMGRQQVALGFAYLRWRGRLPVGWRQEATALGLAQRLGVLRVIATMEPMDTNDAAGETYVMVSVSRSDHRPPSEADVTLVRGAFLPGGIAVEQNPGGERMQLVYLSAILPAGLAWGLLD